MKINKYGNILTVLLIIVIIAGLAGAGFLIYKAVKAHLDGERQIEAIAEFDKIVEEEKKEEQDDSADTSIEVAEATGGGSGTAGKNKAKYKGYVMLGYITIPKTSVQQPILDTVTPDSLNTAVATLYPSNAQLNQPGNVVIVGHNYRNGQFFSNNKKLSVGDKLTIKDGTGKVLTYTIYEKFETTEQDTSFYNRDTNGAIEVTLSTCTDDAKSRIIIFARAE